MTPKKAIIILLILFLAVAVAFVLLYIKNQPAVDQATNQPANNGDNSSASSTQGGLTPVEQKIEAIETKTKDQVEKIVEQGTTATGGITKDAAIKLEDTINQALIEGAKLKTPEQLKADQQKQADREKMEQEINQRIKDQLQNK